MSALRGVKVLGFCSNLPAPKLLSKLADMGAEVHKIEPQQGDPLFHAYPQWYKDIHEKIDVSCVDLKTPEGESFFHKRLAESDVLITSFRPSSLDRLGLSAPSLLKMNPTLFHLAIVGHPQPDMEKPGHDLTYQAAAGLIRKRAMPSSLHVDLLGVQMCLVEVLSALMQKKRGTQYFALEEAAKEFSIPLLHKATIPSGFLGGGHFLYNIYATKKGDIALAAIEPHFQERLKKKLELKELSQENLINIFKTKEASDWEKWAVENDIPITRLRDEGDLS